MPVPQQHERAESGALRSRRVREVARVFLRLGMICFGGPSAHLAMMEDEVVRRHRWMTTQELPDLVAVTNLNQGRNSTEMALHIGYRRIGWDGLIAGA